MARLLAFFTALTRLGPAAASLTAGLERYDVVEIVRGGGRRLADASPLGERETISIGGAAAVTLSVLWP